MIIALRREQYNSISAKTLKSTVDGPTSLKTGSKMGLNGSKDAEDLIY
jgi:hypothetical protein